jgi:hypothetical protein
MGCDYITFDVVLIAAEVRGVHLATPGFVQA